MVKLKYKIGDKVRIKSLDWYNENKSKRGFICFDYANFIPEMSRYCGETLTINRVVEEFEHYLVLECAFSWTDEMIEGLVEEEVFIKANDIYNEEYSKGEYCHEQSFKWGFQEGYSYSHENDKLEISLKEGYQFKDEHGNIINAKKIVLEKKKTEYPKTYMECYDILGCCSYNIGFDRCETSYDESLQNMLLAFRELYICRNAYWKLYGEEMGLGKPWEPDYSGTFEHGTPIKYVIYNIGTHIVKERKSSPNHILSFPTEEMRDAFYENFKELIGQCKELL